MHYPANLLPSRVPLDSSWHRFKGATAALVLWALCCVGSSFLTIAAVAEPSSDQLRVVTTIKPVHSLTSAVMQGVGTPHLLIDGAGSPHQYRQRPSDAIALNTAHVVIRVSPIVEPFMTKMAKALPASTSLVTLVDLPGLKIWPVRTGAKFDAHFDAHEEHGHDDHALLDGHIWLDPDNAKKITTHIGEVLAARAPAHAKKLRENAQRLVTQIDELAKDINARMAGLKTQRFIVFHDAFQYFERSFGLQAAGAITLRADTPPGAKRLLSLRRNIRDLNVACAFSEPQFRARVIDTVIEGLDVRKGVLDPIGATLTPGPGLYGQLMQNLAKGFESCLGKGS